MSYVIDIAKAGRAGCKGPQPCSGSKINKGELRFGSINDNNAFGGSSTYW